MATRRQTPRVRAGEATDRLWPTEAEARRQAASLDTDDWEVEHFDPPRTGRVPLVRTVAEVRDPATRLPVGWVSYHAIADRQLRAHEPGS